MTPQELATRLDGREIGSEITPAEEQLAAYHGLVVVFGASDDLMEFRGAIDDEVGCYHGTSVLIDPQGILPDWGDARAESEEYVEQWQERRQRHGGGVQLTAVWDADTGHSWTYETAIPHATFEVLEAGEPYCRGIVFRLADAVPGEGE